MLSWLRHWARDIEILASLKNLKVRTHAPRLPQDARPNVNKDADAEHVHAPLKIENPTFRKPFTLFGLLSPVESRPRSNNRLYDMASEFNE